MSDLMQRFVPHRVARPRFAFLTVSEVNVDFGNEISVLECLQKFMDEDMWQLSEQRNIHPNLFFAAHPTLKPQSRARSSTDKHPTEMKILIGLKSFYNLEWHVLLQNRKYWDTTLLTSNDREKILSPKTPSLCGYQI